MNDYASSEWPMAEFFLKIRKARMLLDRKGKVIYITLFLIEIVLSYYWSHKGVSVKGIFRGHSCNKRRIILANHKSALKRNRQSLVSRARNRANRSKVKTVIKAVDAAIEQQSVDQAQAALKAAIPVIQKAALKGTRLNRTASRKVSRLTKRVNSFIASTQSAA